MEWLLVSDGLVWVFQKLLIYWDFHAQPSLGFTENGPKRENIQWAAVVWTKMPCWCQRRMGRLVRDDRKATVTQITTRYNQGMQNTISERTTRRTLKQLNYSRRRPHRVSLLSAKNRKQRLQFTQAHQNGIIEDWKNVAWSDESWFLLRHSDCRVSIHGQQLWWTILQLACQLHAPSKRATSVALCCVIKLHILEWPFIVFSLRHTCAIIMLSNQHLDMTHLWGGWIISTEEKCSLTQI